MLKKSERVSRKEFMAHYHQGKKLHSTNLSVAISPTPTFHGSVVVSKKVAKLAVERNSMRRRIYGELRQLRVVRPATYIVMVRPEYVKLTKREAKAELESLIGRIVKSA
jgi:ribonuclease P protein component